MTVRKMYALWQENGDWVSATLQTIEENRLEPDSDRYGTTVANKKIRTRRVDEGKSGQAQKIAVSGGFGGGILSQELQQAF